LTSRGGETNLGIVSPYSETPEDWQEAGIAVNAEYRRASLLSHETKAKELSLSWSCPRGSTGSLWTIRTFVMFRKPSKAILVAVVVAGLTGVAGAAPIGRPVSFDIALYQGGVELFSETVTIDVMDGLDGSYRYKIVDDYDTFPAGAVTSVWLSVEMPSPDQDTSNIHFYVRGASPVDPDLHGADPLVALNDTDKITATITGLNFESGGSPTDVSVLHYDRDDMAGAYMFDFDYEGSYYYVLPDALLFDLGPNNLTQQVPQSSFVDTDVNNYVFLPGSGTQVDIGWYDMPSGTSDPNGDYPVVYQDGTAGLANGDVFELGLAAVVVQVPEPATVGMCLVGGLACFRRRR